MQKLKCNLKPLRIRGCPASNVVQGKINEPAESAGEILNFNLYQSRYNKALKCANLITGFVPFIIMVALTGSMANKNITRNSDIDFFIQTKKGRIWTARFLSSLLIWTLGQKRYDRGPIKKIAGRICLNWYGTENLPEKRKYQYEPLYCSSKSRACQGRSRELRITKTSRFSRRDIGITRRIIKNPLELILSGKIGDWLENILKKYQIRRIKGDPRTHQSGSQVRYSDSEIGLHP